MKRTDFDFDLMITHRLTSIDTCAWVFGQKQNRNHASIFVFTRLGYNWLFPLPKTEDTDEKKRFATVEKIKENSKIAVGDTKKRVSVVFQGLEKTLT